MKISIVFIIAAIISLPLFSEDAPVFSHANSTVLDTSREDGKIRDNIRLVNVSKNKNMNFTVYAYHAETNEWQIAGSGLVKGYCDTDTITPLFKESLDSYRYFAVLPKGEEQFSYEIKKSHHDLYIYIHDADFENEKTRDYKNAAFLLHSDSVSGEKIKDNIRFTNLSEDENISFTVYAFNSEDEPWQKIGTVYLQGFNNTDSIGSAKKGMLKNFKEFGIVSNNGKDYTFTAEGRHNDLYITVQ